MDGLEGKNEFKRMLNDIKINIRRGEIDYLLKDLMDSLETFKMKINQLYNINTFFGDWFEGSIEEGIKYDTKIDVVLFEETIKRLRMKQRIDYFDINSNMEKMGFKLIYKGDIIIEKFGGNGILKNRLVEVENNGKYETYRLSEYHLENNEISYVMEDENGDEVENQLKKYLFKYISLDEF